MARRRLRIFGLLVACVAAAYAIAAPAPASAADDCPNAAIRAEQGSDHLSRCRAWELVSLPDTGGNKVLTSSPLAIDGDRVMWGTFTGGAEGSTSGSKAQFISTRSAGGWVSHGLLPPKLDSYGDTYQPMAVSRDLRSWIAAAYDGLGSHPPYGSLVRLNADGTQELLHTRPYGGGWTIVASDDLQHAYQEIPETHDPSHQPGTDNVYDVASAPPELVSRMPGTGLAPDCGTGGVGFALGVDRVAMHWTSSDGANVFFLTRGDDAVNGCVAPQQLYVRNVDADVSKLISGPPVVGDPDNGVERFIQATPDGSRVFYVTATSLEAADDTDADANDRDIYRYTAAAGNECLTCAIPNANVESSGGGGGGGTSTGTVVAEDGSRVYFDSLAQYGAAPSAGTVEHPNTYLWTRDDGEIRFVAQASGVNHLAPTTSWTQLTPDGSVMVFTSNSPALDAATGSSNGGFFQYYRYDDGDGSVVCVSCPATPSADVPPELIISMSFGLPESDRRVLSDDGDAFVFRSPDALVPEDVNGQTDIYEWYDGTVALVTDGTTDRPDGGSNGEIAPSALSPDGDHLLFFDIASYVPGGAPGVPKLYDAAIGGGFALPPPSAAPCSGDACRSPVQGAPPMPGPATPAFEGPSDSARRVVCARPLVRSGSRCVTKLTAARKACRGRPRARRRACVVRHVRQLTRRQRAAATCRRRDAGRDCVRREVRRLARADRAKAGRS